MSCCHTVIFSSSARLALHAVALLSGILVKTGQVLLVPFGGDVRADVSSVSSYTLIALSLLTGSLGIPNPGVI